MLTSDKHSNLLGQLPSYKENEVLWIRTQYPFLLSGNRPEQAEQAITHHKKYVCKNKKIKVWRNHFSIKTKFEKEFYTFNFGNIEFVECKIQTFY